MATDNKRLEYLKEVRKYVKLLIELEDEYRRLENENKKESTEDGGKRMDGLHPRVSSTDKKAGDKYAGWVYRFPGDYD